VRAKLVARESELAEAEDGWAKSKAAQSAATSRAAEANERSQRACKQIGEYEAKLAELRAELREKKSELEAVRLQLTDANDGGAKSGAKAEILHIQNDMAGPVKADEDRGIMERMRAMEAQIASMQKWMKDGPYQSHIYFLDVAS